MAVVYITICVDRIATTSIVVVVVVVDFILIIVIAYVEIRLIECIKSI